MRYCESHFVEGRNLLEVPKSVVDKGVETWGSALVGQEVLGERIQCSVISSTADMLWGRWQS